MIPIANRLRAAARPVWPGAVMLALASAAPLWAQSPPPLTSNRPGIGESEVLVPAGSLQFEGGTQLSVGPGTRDRALALGQPTFRYGVTSWFELFGGSDGYVHAHGAASGASDLRLGAKLAIVESKADQPWTLTVSPGWSLPTGTGAFTSTSHDVSLRALWARGLPRAWSVSGNVYGLRTTVDGDRSWQSLTTLSVARQLSDTTGAFVEIAASHPEGGPSHWMLDGGLAVVSGEDVQWDVSTGRRVGGHGVTWFVSAGLTLRHR